MSLITGQISECHRVDHFVKRDYFSQLYGTTRKHRDIETKIYECFFLNGTATPEPMNPESLSPVGNLNNEWSCTSRQMTEVDPVIAKYRETWEKSGPWVTDVS